MGLAQVGKSIKRNEVVVYKVEEAIIRDRELVGYCGGIPC